MSSKRAFKAHALRIVVALLAAAGSRDGAARPPAVVTAAELMGVRDLESMSVSPDGKWVAFQIVKADPSRNLHDAHWFVTTTDAVGRQPLRIASAGELSQSDVTSTFRPAPPPIWSPDGRWIAYLRTEEGRTQIWRASRDGTGQEQLTHSKSNVRAVAFAPDGRRLLFETQPGREELRAALAAEERVGFLYDRRFVPIYDLRPVRAADAELVEGTYERRSLSDIRSRRLWTIDLASRRERPATSEEAAEFAALTEAPHVPDGRRVRGQAVAAPSGGLAWTEARDPEQQGGLAPLTIVARPLEATEPVVCLALQCMGQRIHVIGWRGNDEVVFIRREGYLLREIAIYLWQSRATTLPRLVLRTSDKLVANDGSPCKVAGNRLICFYERPDYPRQLVSIDLNTNTIETLFDPNPHFSRFDLGVAPQYIELRTASGAETFGYLVLPPKYDRAQRLPLVVVTYRCSGFLRGGTGDEYPIFPMAAQGHAVLCINAPDTNYQRLATVDWRVSESLERGEGDPEKRRMQDCLDAAVAKLAAMGVVDPNRVGVTGLSFGSETVHFALFNMPTLVAAIASGGGNEPSSAFLAPIGAHEITEPWGLASASSQRWDTLALSRNVEGVRAPLLLNVADHEMLGVLESFAALRDAGRAVEMYVFPDEYHIKWQPAHRLAIYERNVDWMNFWLRGVEDPVLAKAEQYTRWRAMRVKQCELFNGGDAPWYCHSPRR